MKKKIWFIVILVILAVAVALTLVFVNIFREKNTTALAENINSVTQSGYLNSEDEANVKMDSYLRSLCAISEQNALDDVVEIQNYLKAFEAFETMGQFFNREITYTHYTSTYNKNRKKIASSFSKAQDAIDELEEYYDTTVSITDHSETWLAQTWKDTKGLVETIYTSTWDALSRLMSVYEESVTSSLMNNALTSTIFDGIEFLQTNISEDTTATAGDALKTFVNAYLSQDSEQYILGYSYDSQLQETIADIAENWEEASYYQDFIGGTLFVGGEE